MEFTSLEIPEVKLVRSKRHVDSRGYFTETYSRHIFSNFGIDCEFVQDNQSLSKRTGTIRGLHFQAPPVPQAKLVRVLAGSIFDVVVDIRRNSPTYGKWCAVTLAADGDQLFIPHGFAHGFCTLTPEAVVAYKVDGHFAPECNRGLIWNDPDLAIAWPLNGREAILSETDARLPPLSTLASPFTYEGRA
jgi:dTDP-4-dehydrorhamnose 3,5-epimerase